MYVHQERQKTQSTCVTMSPTANDTEIRARLHTLLQRRNKNQSLQDVLEADISDDAFPPSPSPNTLTNEVVYYLTQPEVTGKAYSDLTGRLPHRSSRGNEYLLVGTILMLMQS